MKVAFHTVKGEKKRGPGLDVSLASLFAEAKAEDTIVAEGWNTLGTSVTNIGLQLRKRSEHNTQSEHETTATEEALSEELNEENLTTSIMTQQAQPDDYSAPPPEPSGAFICCARHFLESRDGFKQQKSAFQELVKKSGHIFGFYPK